MERNGGRSSPPPPPSPGHVVRPVRPDELALLPDIESAADTLFEPLGIGPLPGPGTVEEFAAALVVFVVDDPPVGLCRIDGMRTGDGYVVAHLEQLSVHPDHGGQGVGRALLRAACEWAAEQGYGEITLATYRDIPWNGPFYASEGFVERASSVDGFLQAHGLPPEEPVMRRFGARVLMSRSLR